jgi:group I intron endonuclease
MAGIKSGIYRITNRNTGKVYIGSAVNIPSRLGVHKAQLRGGYHGNAKLQSSWNKHGEAAFSFDVLFVVFDRRDLAAAEQIFIDEYDAASNGYNILHVAYSPAGYKCTPEQAERRRKSLEKGYVARTTWTPERRAAHSLALTGRSMPPATVERGERISAAKKGKKFTKEHVEAIRASRRANYLKNLPVWLELKGQGKSLREIEKITGNSRKAISQALKDHGY